MKTFILLLLITFFGEEINSQIVYNFKASDNLNDWYIVDDRVMGGLSRGNIKLGKSGNAIYYGDVTTENNGGFSSLRYQFNSKNVSNYSKVSIKLKGDGTSYQFRIKSDRRQRYSYVATFNTSGDWETITIPFNNFVPQFRGYKVNVPNYDGKMMEEIAFLIGNKTNENFQLEIESIVLIK